MKTLLENAIKEQRLVHLLYDGRSRTVEPYVMGKNDKQEDVFLGRQITPWMPKRESWLVFRLNKIYGLLILDGKFTQTIDATELPSRVLAGIRLMI